jgi:hypothetical protein
LDRVGAVVFPLALIVVLANVVSAIGTVAHSPNARAAFLLVCAVAFALVCAAFFVGAAAGAGIIG